MLNSGATTHFSCTPARLVRRRCVAELGDEIERQRPYMQRAKTVATSGWDIVSEEMEMEVVQGVFTAGWVYEAPFPGQNRTRTGVRSGTYKVGTIISYP
jgi:hypothetical protein